MRAQRFARTRVAEMLLHKVRQVHAGRESNSLYAMLKEEIEEISETVLIIPDEAEATTACPDKNEQRASLN